MKQHENELLTSSGANLKQLCLERTSAHAGNSGLAKVSVSCSADTFVVNQTFVLRINICGENRHLCQPAKR